MKRTPLLIIILFFFIACSEVYKPREKVNISINKIKLDSTSIRAIEIINDSTIVYAGSKGDLGFLTNFGDLEGKIKIITDTITPHFRALAHTKNAVFALSIGNPALLYKYQNKQLKIVYKEENDKVFYNSMQFFDDLNGIAMGDPTSNCLSIITTQDGGNTWNKVPCENLPEIAEGEAAFAASNTNIAIVGTQAWIVTGGVKSSVYHTSDLGLTWNVYNTPIIQGTATTGIYSVDFYDNNRGIICGGNYLDKFGNSANKAITKNGGKTWEIVAENTAPKYISCVQYVPETEGKEVFAVSTNGVFYSKNYGKEWEKVSDEGFYSIRFYNKNTAWLSGNNVVAKMQIE
ncbi:oxidoreductase [Lutibacter sp. A80]|uniref:sialidase family protein n=1 Tax=Lutibacter sp. A80 TaxID=2918453 RepID=UPI001F053BD8|nr:oxidoreductase [Lutibacter sp. A80]UMB61276.1 oxidoreductase [Lutibacter sp. A80]